MSSLARARSLRKPADLSSAGKQSEQRNASPSRLPVKPASASSTAKSASSGIKTTKPALGPLRRTPSLKKPATTPAQEPVKKEPTKYPPSTMVTRPLSMIRPTSAGGPATARVKATATHARAKSTAVQSTSRPPSRDQIASRTVRPPSRDQATSRTSRPPSREAATVGTRTGHGRAVSTEKATGAQTPRPKPGLSMLQQHYSPVKTPGAKPATSTYTGPPSPSKLPANVATSAETSRLQTELLQLHIIYRDAAEVEEQWHASAKEKLGAKFQQLSASSREISGLENAGVEADNAKALRKWASGDQLESNIQALDTVMNGVWMLSEPGGKYAKLVRRFERWIERVWDIEEARNRKDGGQALLARGQDSLFIEALEQSWKDECAAMTRKLQGWREQLEEVGEYPDDGMGKSSLEKMLEGSRSLVIDMLAELGAMEDIEQAAVAREEAWIDEMNRDGDNDDGPRAGAIWRAV